MRMTETKQCIFLQTTHRFRFVTKYGTSEVAILLTKLDIIPKKIIVFF